MNQSETALAKFLTSGYNNDVVR